MADFIKRLFGQGTSEAQENAWRERDGFAALQKMLDSESVFGPEGSVERRGEHYFVPHHYDDKHEAFAKAIKRRLSLKEVLHNDEGVLLSAEEIHNNAGRLRALAGRQDVAGTVPLLKQIEDIVSAAKKDDASDRSSRGSGMASTADLSMPSDAVTAFLSKITGENWVWHLRDRDDMPTIVYSTENALLNPEKAVATLGAAFAARELDIATPLVENGRAVLTQDMLFEEQRDIPANPSLIGTPKGEALDLLLHQTGKASGADDNDNGVSSSFAFKLEALTKTGANQDRLIAELKADVGGSFISVETVQEVLHDITTARLGVSGKWDYDSSRKRFNAMYEVQPDGRVKTSDDDDVYDMIRTARKKPSAAYAALIDSARQEGLKALLGDFTPDVGKIYKTSGNITGFSVAVTNPEGLLALHDRLQKISPPRAITEEDMTLLAEMRFGRETCRKELRCCPEGWVRVPEEGYEGRGNDPHTPHTAKLYLNVPDSALASIDQYARDIGFALNDDYASELGRDEKGSYIEVRRIKNPLTLDAKLDDLHDLSRVMVREHSDPVSRFLSKITGVPWKSEEPRDDYQEGDPDLKFHCTEKRLANAAAAAQTLKEAFAELGVTLKALVSHHGSPLVSSQEVTPERIDELATKAGSFDALVSGLREKCEGKFSPRQEPERGARGH